MASVLDAALPARRSTRRSRTSLSPHVPEAADPGLHHTRKEFREKHNLPLSRSRVLWLCLAALQAHVIVPRAYVVDNHKLLMLYWTVALGLAVHDKEALTRNARLLVGACFAFASFWKLTTPEFVNGSFIHYTLLVDERFGTVARILGGMSETVLRGNDAVVSAVISGRVAEATLRDSARLDMIATAATQWTLAVELGIALSFLFAPASSMARNARNVLLLQFILLTYPIATVIGFGWLLTILGYAQSDQLEWKFRALYLGTFLLLQVCLVPWGDVLLPEAE